MNVIIAFVMLFVFGFALGFVLSGLHFSGKMDEPVGDFVINESKPTEDLLHLNFTTDFDEFKDRDYIIFNIVKK